MDFSLAECFETTAIGKSTSAKRLHSLGIIQLSLFTTLHISNPVKRPNSKESIRRNRPTQLQARIRVERDPNRHGHNDRIVVFFSGGKHY